jgi:hypothetical protein
MPSADPKADAMESSVVGEKGDDHAEKNCENKDNINGGSKGGGVDKGGNEVNDTDEMKKLKSFSKRHYQRIKFLILLILRSTLELRNIIEQHAKKIMACLLFHGLRKSRHLCDVIFEMMLR